MEKKKVVRAILHIVLMMVVALSITMYSITLIDKAFAEQEKIAKDIGNANPPKLGDYEDEIIDKISVLTVKNDDGMIYQYCGDMMDIEISNDGKEITFHVPSIRCSCFDEEGNLLD